jgi:hypothetical protein
MEATHFPSSEALLNHIKERSDDIEKVVIFGPGTCFTAPDESRTLCFTQSGMIFHFVGGKRQIIGPDDAEILLKDGLLTRMRVKTEFLR